MQQFSDETVTAWGTRLNGHAKMCDMLVQCEGCENDVSFAEKMIMYQFVKGLKDTHAQERILEASAQVEGGELTLARTVKLAESFEMGKSSQEYVNKHSGQVSRISQHQQNKHSGRQSTRSNNSNSAKPGEMKCGNCGQNDHTSKLNDRRKSCPAFDKLCNKCQTNGHFSNLCRGGPRSTR
jgi:hypothetical protein